MIDNCDPKGSDGRLRWPMLKTVVESGVATWRVTSSSNYPISNVLAPRIGFGDETTLIYIYNTESAKIAYIIRLVG